MISCPINIRWTVLSAVLLHIASTAAQSTAAEIKATPDGANKVVIAIDGQPFTEYLTDDGPKPLHGPKPALWPIFGPTGEPMTRAFPMSPRVAGERKDHPHHRSLWFTHGDVNGVDFWAEFSKSNNLGRQRHREFRRIESGQRAVIETVNDWVGPKDRKLLEDLRTLSFHVDGRGSRIIDFDITLTAVEPEVKFGDTKEGTFGLRVPTSMDVDTRKGGRVANSNGQVTTDPKDDKTWGQAAAWVDYSGPVGDQNAGIAVLNHPSSFRHPTYWHVRTYGLFAANPFGKHDFERNEQLDGSHTLKQGESIRLRYRVLFHAGDEKTADIAAAYAAYASEP